MVNGVKSASLIDGGKGYSDTNPPVVQVQSPTKPGATQAKLKATVTNGAVSGLEVVNSGSGYTFTPRITFRQPGGCTLGTGQILNGSISMVPPITYGGFGYTTAPHVYVDEPTGESPIRANIKAHLVDGAVSQLEILIQVVDTHLHQD